MSIRRDEDHPGARVFQHTSRAADHIHYRIRAALESIQTRLLHHPFHGNHSALVLFHEDISLWISHVFSEPLFYRVSDLLLSHAADLYRAPHRQCDGVAAGDADLTAL